MIQGTLGRAAAPLPDLHGGPALPVHVGAVLVTYAPLELTLTRLCWHSRPCPDRDDARRRARRHAAWIGARLPHTRTVPYWSAHATHVDVPTEYTVAWATRRFESADAAEAFLASLPSAVEGGPAWTPDGDALPDPIQLLGGPL